MAGYFTELRDSLSGVLISETDLGDTAEGIRLGKIEGDVIAYLPDGPEGTTAIPMRFVVDLQSKRAYLKKSTS